MFKEVSGRKDKPQHKMTERSTIMDNLNIKNPFNAEFKAPPMPNVDLSGKGM